MSQPAEPAKRTFHLHNNGIRYAVRLKDGAERCDWYSCTYNVYNSFDEPEQVIVIDAPTTEGDQR